MLPGPACFRDDVTDSVDCSISCCDVSALLVFKGGGERGIESSRLIGGVVVASLGVKGDRAASVCSEESRRVEETMPSPTKL